MLMWQSHQPVRAGFGSISQRFLIAGAVAGAICLLLLGVGARLLNDPDTFWHIAVGRWIIGHGAWPSADPFSFTMAGMHWIAKEWLSQLIFAEAFGLGGWTGVVVVAAAAIAIAFALLTYALLDELPPIPVLILVTGAFVLAAPHLLARPHALALPVMLAFVAGLVRASDSGKAPPLALAVLMAAWANLHGGFTLGLLLIVPSAVEVVWQAPADDRRRLALGWLRFAVLALAAACVTPYGPESILVTQRVLGLGPALTLISEWQPQDFGRIEPFEVVMLAAIGFALLRGIALPPLRALVLIGLLHLALAHVRNAELLGLLAPLYLARPLAVALDPAASVSRSTPYGLGPRAFLLGFAGLVIAAILELSLGPPMRPNPAYTPSAAVATLKQSKVEKVLNDYEFGGYLIAEGIAPFIDSRAELYGGDFLTRVNRAFSLADMPDFLRLLDEYHVDATLLAPARPAVALLDRLPGWKRLYADDIAVVHVRRPIDREDKL